MSGSREAQQRPDIPGIGSRSFADPLDLPLRWHPREVQTLDGAAFGPPFHPILGTFRYVGCRVFTALSSGVARTVSAGTPKSS